jgi:hypothetical protein
MKGKRESENIWRFAPSKGQKTGDLRFLPFNSCFFSFPEGRLQNLFN